MEADPSGGKRRVVREEEKVKQTPAAGKGVWSEEREVRNRPQRREEACGQRGRKSEADPSRKNWPVVKNQETYKQRAA